MWAPGSGRDNIVIQPDQLRHNPLAHSYYASYFHLDRDNLFVAAILLPKYLHREIGNALNSICFPWRITVTLNSVPGDS
jgi:hypothetical protein